MYVRPHSKHRENPQINPWSGLEWNVSRWDCSPAVSQCYACQSHWAHTVRHTHGMLCNLREEERVVRTDNFVVMFMGLTKPMAFPDNPCQVCVWCSFQTLSLSNTVFVFFIFYKFIYFKCGFVRTGAKKFKQSQESIWSLLRILLCDYLFFCGKLNPLNPLKVP